MRRRGLMLVWVVVGAACGASELPPESPCKAAYHCATQADGTYACEAGYKWQTPNDPSAASYSCVPSGTADTWCGDGKCNSNETPTSCSADCSVPASCDGACQCANGLYTQYTCLAADPCHWIGDGYCDGPSCAPLGLLTDVADCPTPHQLTINASVSCTKGTDYASDFILHATDGANPQQWSAHIGGSFSYTTMGPDVLIYWDGDWLSFFTNYCLGMGGATTFVITVTEGGGVLKTSSTKFADPMTLSL